MNRCVEAEWLDTLPADDAGAIHSRRDLKRLNRLLGHSWIVSRLLRTFHFSKPVRRLVDLGGGDGEFAWQLARRLARRWPSVEVLVVDRQRLINVQTRKSFESIGWAIEAEQADVFDWLRRAGEPDADLILANLFLHHFQEQELRTLFALAARRTGVFVSCDPRRTRFAPVACHLLWAIGCNRITCHDAIASVRAGFSDAELSRLWPPTGGWRTLERHAGLFSHTFAAFRDKADAAQDRIREGRLAV